MLVEANCARSDWSGANLQGADLYGADLSDASLKKTNLFGASLLRAKLDRADLSETIGLTKEQLANVLAWRERNCRRNS